MSTNWRNAYADKFAGLDFHTGLMLILALLFVLFYEAINGFHDTANAVATLFIPAPCGARNLRS